MNGLTRRRVAGLTETGQQFLTLNDWYSTELGQVVSGVISEKLAPIVAPIYGYHALQLGVDQNSEWLDLSPIKHKIFQSDAPEAQAGVIAPYNELPFASKSIDLILAPHVLSYTANVAQTISEIDRVLVTNGHVIFIGFNRLSWWGLAQSLLCYSKDAPWNGAFHGAFQLAHTLREYGYSIDTINDFFYRPPFSSAYYLEKSRFLEAIGDLVWPYPGGLYLLHAKKQTAKLTRIRPLWSFRNIVIGKRYVQPIG